MRVLCDSLKLYLAEVKAGTDAREGEGASVCVCVTGRKGRAWGRV